MIRKGLLVFAWFPLTVILVINNLYLLSVLGGKDSSHNPVQAVLVPYSDFIAVADSGQKELIAHGSSQVLGASIEAGDARPILLTEFMKGSPLEPYAELIISEADKYNIDYRVVPAIAMCESNLGKRIPSSDSHNAWGIAVYTGQLSGATFNDWPSAISWVYKYMYDTYTSKGIVEVKEIGSIWAPPSINTGHSWAKCVTTFMDAIQ